MLELLLEKPYAREMGLLLLWDYKTCQEPMLKAAQHRDLQKAGKLFSLFTLSVAVKQGFTKHSSLAESDLQ